MDKMVEPIKNKFPFKNKFPLIQIDHTMIDIFETNPSREKSILKPVIIIEEKFSTKINGIKLLALDDELS